MSLGVSQCLEEGICDLFEENDAIIEKEVERDGIRDAERGEQPQNWIFTPILIPRSYW